MVQMTPQDMKSFAETIAPKVDDDDQPDNTDAYNHPPSGLSGDPRDRKPTFDLYKVDYDWVKKQTSKKELKGAYHALKEDNGFPDLLAAVRQRLKEVDPSFKTTEDFNNYTPAEAAAANDDVNAFLDQMRETDNKIRGGDSSAPSQRSKAIFEDSRAEKP